MYSVSYSLFSSIIPAYENSIQPTFVLWILVGPTQDLFRKKKTHQLDKCHSKAQVTIAYNKHV